jgi:hypothetical protein
MDHQQATSVEAYSLDVGKALTSESSNGNRWKVLEALGEEIAGGLLYTHSRANANTSRILEAASFLYALIELLEEKGIISIEALDARKDVVAQRVENGLSKRAWASTCRSPRRISTHPRGRSDRLRERGPSLSSGLLPAVVPAVNAGCSRGCYPLGPAVPLYHCPRCQRVLQTPGAGHLPLYRLPEPSSSVPDL